jgi:hypothetical protein
MNLPSTRVRPVTRLSAPAASESPAREICSAPRMSVTAALVRRSSTKAASEPSTKGSSDDELGQLEPARRQLELALGAPLGRHLDRIEGLRGKAGRDDGDAVAAARQLDRIAPFGVGGDIERRAGDEDPRAGDRLAVLGTDDLPEEHAGIGDLDFLLQRARPLRRTLEGGGGPTIRLEADDQLGDLAGAGADRQRTDDLAISDDFDDVLAGREIEPQRAIGVRLLLDAVDAQHIVRCGPGDGVEAVDIDDRPLLRWCGERT